MAAGPRYTIALNKTNFVVSKSDSKEVLARVPLDQTPLPAGVAVNFSTDRVKMQWSGTGLSIDVGRSHYTTNFRAVPTSPRLRTAAEIRRAIDANHSEGLKLTASALSGWYEKGSTLYLVVTWQDHPGMAWLSALEKINLSDELPRPVTEAILPGVPFTGKAIDQKALSIGDNILVYVHSGPVWGRWTYSTKTAKTDYLELGKNPKYVMGLAKGQVQAVEKTDYGSYLAKLEDGTTGKVIVSQEFESLPKFVSPDLPQALLTRDGTQLVDLQTGAVMSLDEGASVAPVKGLLLVWFGGTTPDRAWLLSPTSWSPFGWWSAS